MICANPDKMVRKGDHLIYCAGAIADLYAEIGGTVWMAGKPFLPIYEVAMRKAAVIMQTPVAKHQVLAIGDGPETDVRGAADFGLPVVLITGGVNEGGGDLETEVKTLVTNVRILAAMPELTWA